MKVTFKTEKPKGKWAWLDNPTTYIKVDKQNIGNFDTDENDKITIRLRIIKDDINSDGNPNCTWKWIQLKKVSDTLEEAKQFVIDHIKVISEKYNLHKKQED